MVYIGHLDPATLCIGRRENLTRLAFVGASRADFRRSNIDLCLFSRGNRDSSGNKWWWEIR